MEPLDPFEVARRHAARVAQHVGNDEDAALAEDLVRLRRGGAVRAFGEDLAADLRSIVLLDDALERCRYQDVDRQFEEFRVVQEAPIDLRKRQIEVVDCRMESASSLTELREQAPGLQIWAEGMDKDKGKTRFQLQPADELVIYSTPPSSQDLRTVLETVKPVKVHLFAVSPQQEKTEAFLSRLAGLAKYVINQREGSVTLQELAGVTGQREKAVEIGLEWLAAGGHIAIQRQEGSLLLSRGNGDTNQYLQKELFLAVRGMLEETAAYRAHFKRASLDSLFDS